jgi:WD40 repeat protein
MAVVPRRPAPSTPWRMAAREEPGVELSLEAISTWGPSTTFAPMPSVPEDGSELDEARQRLQHFSCAAIFDSGSVGATSLAADQDRAVVATGDGQIYSYAPKSGHLVAVYRSEAIGVRSVSFTHHTGSVLYAGGKVSGSRTGTIVQHRLVDNVAVRMYGGHGASMVRSIAVNPQRDIFISTDDAGKAFLWRIGQSNAVAQCGVGKKPPVACFDPSGKVFTIAASDVGVALYSVSGYAKGPFASSSTVTSLLRRKINARLIAVGETRQSSPADLLEMDEEWTDIASSPDGKFLALTTSLGATHIIDAFSLNTVCNLPPTPFRDDEEGVFAPPPGASSSSSSTSAADTDTTFCSLLDRDGTHLPRSSFSPCGGFLVRPSWVGRPECISLKALASWSKESTKELPTSSFPRLFVGVPPGSASDPSPKAKHTDPVSITLFHPTHAMIMSVSPLGMAFWTPPPAAHRSAAAASST